MPAYDWLILKLTWDWNACALEKGAIWCIWDMEAHRLHLWTVDISGHMTFSQSCPWNLSLVRKPSPHPVLNMQIWREKAWEVLSHARVLYRIFSLEGGGGGYRCLQWGHVCICAPTSGFVKFWTYLRTRNVRFSYNTLIVMLDFVTVLYTTFFSCWGNYDIKYLWRKNSGGRISVPPPPPPLPPLYETLHAVKPGSIR